MLHIGSISRLPPGGLPGFASTGCGQRKTVFPGEFFPCVERLAIDFPVSAIPMPHRMEIKAYGRLIL